MFVMALEIIFLELIFLELKWQVIGVNILIKVETGASHIW